MRTTSFMTENNNIFYTTYISLPAVNDIKFKLHLILRVLLILEKYFEFCLEDRMIAYW